MSKHRSWRRFRRKIRRKNLEPVITLVIITIVLAMVGSLFIVNFIPIMEIVAQFGSATQ